MTATKNQSILILGATGSLGSRTTRMLRRLHPELLITIGARDMEKAAALAAVVGLATIAKVDIRSGDLGIDKTARHNIVVTALRDHSLKHFALCADAWRALHCPFRRRIRARPDCCTLCPSPARFAHSAAGP